MDISLKCNKLIAIYVLENGCLRFVPHFSFVCIDNNRVEIEIQETGNRIISIKVEKPIESDRVYSILTRLERLLQLFDGAFIPLKNITIYGDGNEKDYNTLSSHLLAQRLKYYDSNPVFSINTDRIIKYEDVLTEDVFVKWIKLLEELGVAHQMYLYATSNCRLTNDIPCAFLIELSESLIEIIENNTSIVLQRIIGESSNSRSLKICLRTLIAQYGYMIFKAEINYGIEKIIECLINARVNIMHIKTNKRMPELNGKEACLYLIKMSYLYRFIVFELLGIDKNTYQGALTKRIEKLDAWDGIENRLFLRLK